MVLFTLESDLILQLQTITAADGSYRFESLPAGKYLLIFKKKGYLESKRPLELPSGGNLQLNVSLVTKIDPEKAVASVVPRKSPEISWHYSSDYFQLIPNADSIYAILAQTPAVDTNSGIIGKGYSNPGANGE